MEGPAQWGPAMWDSMHAFAASFPETPTPEDRARAKAWFAGLGSKLPCDACAQKYDKLVTQMRDADLQSRSALFEWTVRIHNVTNMLLGKPIFSIPDAKIKYGLSVRNDIRGVYSRSSIRGGLEFGKV